MARIWQVGALVLTAGTLLLAGCQLLALAGGKGKQDALYKFGKNQRVLVLVDVREGVTPPPSFKTALADKVSSHLYHYKAADNLVTQEKVVQLEQNDPAKFKAMGIADIAQMANADAVLRVYVTRLETISSSDGTVAEGNAEVFVKVVDRDGKRVWPGDATGARVTTHVNPELLSDRGIDAIMQEMTEDLTVKTGRMFHPYALDDASMTGKRIGQTY